MTSTLGNVRSVMAPAPFKCLVRIILTKTVFRIQQPNPSETCFVSQRDRLTWVYPHRTSESKNGPQWATPLQTTPFGREGHEWHSRALFIGFARPLRRCCRLDRGRTPRSSRVDEVRAFRCPFPPPQG